MILFDLDGCLVDSRPGILAAVHAAMADEGLPPMGDDDLEWLIGPPLGTGFEMLLTRLGRDAARWPALLEAYRRHYVEVMLDGTVLVPGIEAVVRRLAADGAVAVVTSKPAYFARPILEHLGMLDLFVTVEGPSLTDPDEPKTVTLARALPASTMIGDRHHDVEAGRAHGLRTIGVTWGIGDRDELVGAGADAIVDTPEELEAVLSRPERREARRWPQRPAAGGGRSGEL